MFVRKKTLREVQESYEDQLEARDAAIHEIGERLYRRNKDYIRVLNENRRLRADLTLAQSQNRPI